MMWDERNEKQSIICMENRGKKVKGKPVRIFTELRQHGHQWQETKQQHSPISKKKTDDTNMRPSSNEYTQLHHNTLTKPI